MFLFVSLPSKDPKVVVPFSLILNRFGVGFFYLSRNVLSFLFTLSRNGTTNCVNSQLYFGYPDEPKNF